MPYMLLKAGHIHDKYRAPPTTMRSEPLLIWLLILPLILAPHQTRWPEFDRDLGGKPAGMPV
ncbi:hypothetical protein CQ014_04145 [Pseudomonas lurida]|nr:hypothetical protein CLM75_06175 [Pseudomonas lurida]PRA18463.1 hypothetical protein CQ002_04125 [Pseudomonas sp. MYb13]PRA24170.1 hypothetical protein CQ004_04145 [Pseudomonas lurida]PRA39231.1 hypothetical protein CQ005_04655 [Pseudomonas lurida]PRC03114.1 hypothetical protein CQ014_04145 [Pseudomonas lurida]